MNYETLFTLDEANTAALPPVDAAAALNALTVERDRTSITAAELWENTDLTEYRTLLAAQRDAYALIAGLGTINVAEGTNSRAALAALFPAGSTTRGNLLALVQDAETVSLLVANGLPARVGPYHVRRARQLFGGS